MEFKHTLQAGEGYVIVRVRAMKVSGHTMRIKLRPSFDDSTPTVFLYKPPPRVFVMIAGPSYLGSQQPDCDTGLRLVGARPKPGFLLGSCLEVSVISLIDVR